MQFRDLSCSVREQSFAVMRDLSSLRSIRHFQPGLPLRLKVSVGRSPLISFFLWLWLYSDVTLWLCDIYISEAIPSLSTLGTVWVWWLPSTELRLMVVSRQGNPPPPPARDSTTQGWTVSDQPGIQSGYLAQRADSIYIELMKWNTETSWPSFYFLTNNIKVVTELNSLIKKCSSHYFAWTTPLNSLQFRGKLSNFQGNKRFFSKILDKREGV